jgi:molybdopterin converting factor small subunit
MRFFAAARDATGCATTELDVATLGDALAAARATFGTDLAVVLDCARVWVNGDEPDEGDSALLRDGDEVAVIPPVSGG